MAEPVLKKRKLDHSGDTYVFTPLKFSTLKEDLDDVPEAILKDALLSIIKGDVQLLVELNKSIPTAMATWKRKSSEVEIVAEKPPAATNTVSKMTAPLVTEYKIEEKLNVQELRDEIKSLFRLNPWYSERSDYEERQRNRRRYKEYDYGYDEDSDDDSSSDDDSDEESSFDSDADNERMQENYNALMEKLNKKREEAIVTINAGNRMKGYLITKVLSEEANQSAFDRNGDIDEIDPHPTPTEWIQLTNALLESSAAQLTEGDWVAAKLALEVPKEQECSAENNFFVLSNFPLSRQQVEINFRLSFYKARDYIGKFTITSATKVEGGRTTFLVKASVPAVSMSGRYHETVTFDASRVISFTCSCPVGNHCKHSAALQAQIAQEKDQLLRVMSLSAKYTT